MALKKQYVNCENESNKFTCSDMNISFCADDWWKIMSSSFHTQLLEEQGEILLNHQTLLCILKLQYLLFKVELVFARKAI